LRSDDGFEDREGHQAPFTLQKNENVQRSTPIDREQASNFQRQTTEGQIGKRLSEFLNRADNCVEVRPVAGFEFGMEEFAIGANFEGPAARRDKHERFNPLTEFENLGRQTDGLGRVVSNHAVFDRYFGFHSALLPEENPTGGIMNGQAAPPSARVPNDFEWKQAPHRPSLRRRQITPRTLRTTAFRAIYGSRQTMARHRDEYGALASRLQSAR
jgi:hypothetical protein